MNIGLIINIVIWFVVIIQWFIIYRLDKDIQKEENINILEPIFRSYIKS